MYMPPLNIIFMGTPDFAVPSLKKLLESNHKVVAVVTGVDKERGRGQKISFTPIKQFALENNLPILQPEKLKDPIFITKLKEFNADLFIVVAFKILPKEVFMLPPKGSFNLHASLLPKFRGAAPIQWAIISGEKETGVTTFMLDEKVDTGNIILQKKIFIDEDDNFGSLHNKLSILGAETVLETVNLIDSDNFKLVPQNPLLASPAPKVTKELMQIDWEKPAIEIHNLVRGLSPYPGAFFSFKDKIIKVFKTKLVLRSNLVPKQIEQSKKTLIIGCGKDALEILELQLEGKKKLGIEEFLRGFSFL